MFFAGDEAEFEAFIAALGVTTSTEEPTTTTTEEPTTTTTSTTTEEPTTTVTIPEEMFFAGDEAEFEAFIARLGVNEEPTTSTTTTTQSPADDADLIIPPIRDVDLLPAPDTRDYRENIIRSVMSLHNGRIGYREMADLETAVRSFLADRLHDGRNAVSTWLALRGHVLLHALTNRLNILNEARWIVAGLSLGFNMVAGDRAAMDGFARESGIRAFCEINRPRVLEAIRSEHARNWDYRDVNINDNNRGNIRSISFAANMDIFCPSLLAGNDDIMLMMLQHRAYLGVQRNGAGILQYSLSVDRPRAFTSAIQGPNYLDTADAARLTLPWSRVVFNGEHAYGIGLIRDWYTEAAREIVDPATQLLERQPSGIYSIRRLDGVLTADRRRQYIAMGRFLALAIVHGRPLGLRLSAVVYGHILNQNPTLADMESEEPELVRSLRLMLEADADQLEYYPLEINGEEVAVTMANREELVGRKLRSMVPRGTSQQLDLIVEGFRSILPLNQMTGVTVGNLGNILYGNPRIDVEDLITNLDLSGYNRGDLEIQWLFETLRSFNNQQLSGFVRFATGSAIAPLGGFGTLSRRISIRRVYDATRYPVSHTCFHAVDLPRYLTKAVLEERLREAIAHNGAMHD